MEKEKDGVWRTIRGRRIFIGKGESLGEAMSKSGKFNRSDIREAKEGLSQIDRFNDTNKKSLKDRQKAINKMRSKSVKYSNSVYDRERQDEKNKINENAPIDKNARTRIDRNLDRYSEADRREIRREDLQRQRKDIENFKAKKQSNNKIDNAKEQEIREALKSSYIYKDEKSTEPYLKQYKEKYGEKAVNDAFKYYDDNFVVAKGTTMDSEGLTYNSLLDKKEYSQEALDNYVKGIDKLRNEMQYSYNSKEYNKRADELLKELKNSKNADNKSIKELNEEMLGDKYKGKGETPNLVYSHDRRIDIDKDGHATIWKDGKIERKTNLPDNVKGDKTKDYFDDYLGKLDNDNNETFIQNNTQHGGTREYSKQDLDRMAEAGTKPMKNSYSGYGWEGTKYDSKLSTKDIAKNITEYSKKEFPDVKLARKTDYNGVDIYVTSSDKDLYITDKDIDNYSNKELVDMTNNYGNQMFFDRWAKDNVPSYTKEHTFTADDVRRYMKEDLAKTRQHEMNVSGNEYFLSDYGKKVISGLNKEMNSYNYDDSDGMIDYFNTNFYGYVHIGKSGKPYQVNESKKIKDYVSKKKSNH